MEMEAAKLIGAGLAVIALAGVGVGIGNIFAALVNAIGRITSERVISLKKWDNSNFQDFIENSKIQNLFLFN